MSTLRALASGIEAAVSAPWVGSRKLNELLVLQPAGTRSRENAALALRASRGALRILARLQPVGAPWRSNCLQRSVAGCLVLRRYGVPTRVVLGARAAGAAAVTAHAWVEDADGNTLIEQQQQHTPLRWAAR